MSEWQPLETIPKDGSAVLVLYKNFTGAGIYWWVDKYKCWECMDEFMDESHLEEYYCSWAPCPKITIEKARFVEGSAYEMGHARGGRSQAEKLSQDYIDDEPDPRH